MQNKRYNTGPDGCFFVFCAQAIVVHKSFHERDADFDRSHKAASSSWTFASGSRTRTRVSVVTPLTSFINYKV